MVELSRDGRRVYLTNSLYSPWDAQFYPGGHQRLDGEARRATRAAAWRSTRTSSWSSSRACARTRCGSRAATHRPTRSASLDDRRRAQRCRGPPLLRARRLPRHQPGDGLALRGGAGTAAAGAARAVWRALGPLAAGHALAIAARGAAAGLAGWSCRSRALRWVAAGLLVGLGVYRLVRAGTSTLRRDARRTPASWPPGRSSWPRRMARG